MKMLARVALVAPLAGVPLQAALACGGTAPPPVCGLTLTLSLGMERVVVASNAATTVPVPVAIWLAMGPSPGTTGSACPPRPTAATLALTATCDTGTGGTAATFPIALGDDGWTRTVVDLPIAAGTKRHCTITGSLTADAGSGVSELFADATAEAQLCVVEQAPLSPHVPRLELHLVDTDSRPLAAPAGLAQAHPGDGVTRWYRVTNNDPRWGATLQLTADSQQIAVLPDPGTPLPTTTGAGLFALSDPGGAADPPIARRPYAQCDGQLSLPDPLTSVSPSVATSIRLPAGGSTLVSVVTRTWGACASGTGGSSDVIVTGVFDDGTTVSACGTAALLVDAAVPPAFAWDDSGAQSDVGASGSSLQFTNHAGDFDTLFATANTAATLTLDGSAVTDQAIFYDVEPLGPHEGRHHTVLQLPFGTPTSFAVDATYAVSWDAGALSAVTVDALQPVEGAPAGYDTTSPYATGTITSTVAPKEAATSQVFHQTSAWGVTLTDEWVQLALSAYDVAPADGGWTVHVEGALPTTADPLVELHLLDDLRLFTPAADKPECNSDRVFIVDHAILGRRTNMYLEGAVPGSRVMILYGTTGTGAGPCLPSEPGVCVDLLAPRLVAHTHVDALGTVSVSPYTPTRVAGADVVLQAVIFEPGGAVLTPVVHRTVTR